MVARPVRLERHGRFAVAPVRRRRQCSGRAVAGYVALEHETVSSRGEANAAGVPLGPDGDSQHALMGRSSTDAEQPGQYDVEPRRYDVEPRRPHPRRYDVCPHHNHADNDHPDDDHRDDRHSDDHSDGDHSDNRHADNRDPHAADRHTDHNHADHNHAEPRHPDTDARRDDKHPVDDAQQHPDGRVQGL